MGGADQGINPLTGQSVGAPVPHTDSAGVAAATTAARAAAPAWAALTPPRRADILDAVAAAIEAARADLVPLADAETALGEARLTGELTRTRVQWEMFAAALREGSHLDVVIDPADPDALPAPRPDLRRMMVPLGPVAVYAASNFPFAFSVPGGDTVSALAAGCPVVVKAHPAHPGVSARVAEVIAGALRDAGAPDGVFSVVYGFEAGRVLVTDPAITAAAFTGSIAGGRALFDLAAGRPDPIPFYGELGSLNPTVVTAAAIAARGDELVRGFVGSMTLGAGQFCTKPGLLFLPAGHGLDERLAAAVGAATVGPLLDERIAAGYLRATDGLAEVPGVRPVAVGDAVDAAGWHVPVRLYAVSAADVTANADAALHECFGPAGLIVEYADDADLLAALGAVPGALTATVHAEPDDALVPTLLDFMAARAGRVIWGGWPTGVAVTWAMQHGGPWPATTSPCTPRSASPRSAGSCAPSSTRACRTRSCRRRCGTRTRGACPAVSTAK
ncbi:aldehyde dehydrogenase family protein [Luedemannella flava]